MRILEYIVPEEFSDRPVLHFLKGHLKLSTKIVQSLRHTEGSVTANDRVVRMIDNVYKDETVVIRIPEKSTPPLLCEMDLDIIFEDEDILVLNKPAGISAHPTRRHPNGTLANGVANYIIKNGELLRSDKKEDGTWINVYDNSNGNISVTTDINDKEEPRRGMVTIELTDLKDGEMKIIVPVIQLGHGLSFVKNEYLVDEDWNDIGYNTFILSIKHFSNDVDWNSAFDNSMEIIKNTYSNDIDWNTSIENSNDITIDDFGNDSEWNESADNNISINQNGYEE